jgi:hypothetical protein
MSLQASTSCESYTWNGTTYTTSGTYTYSHANANGCISVDTLHLTINYGTHNSESQTACELYTWHGTTYTNSGVYTYSYTNGSSCASVDTLHLTVNYGTHNSETQTACDTYTWHGTVHTASRNTLMPTLMLMVALQSIHCTLLLTMVHIIRSLMLLVIHTAWHGTTYSASGNYTYSYTNGVRMFIC